MSPRAPSDGDSSCEEVAQQHAFAFLQHAIEHTGAAVDAGAIGTIPTDAAKTATATTTRRERSAHVFRDIAAYLSAILACVRRS